MHEWKITSKLRGNGETEIYCYWTDKNDRKYSTWYYEPFKDIKTAEKWIRAINFNRIPFDTHSLTRTKFLE